MSDAAGGNHSDEDGLRYPRDNFAAEDLQRLDFDGLADADDGAEGEEDDCDDIAPAADGAQHGDQCVGGKEGPATRLPDSGEQHHESRQTTDDDGIDEGLEHSPHPLLSRMVDPLGL